MMVFAVALVLTALVVVAVLVGSALRHAAFCPRREALVDLVDGRCAHRATCLAPPGCERQCITLSRFAGSAAG